MSPADSRPNHAAAPPRPILAPDDAQRIEDWPDETVLNVAAGVCRERAKEAYRLHRSETTADREAHQLRQLARRLEDLRDA